MKSACRVRWFQFQIGSIKSVETPRAETCLQWFQFQIGSIKRNQQLPLLPNRGSFNSKLVRLKVGATNKMIGIARMFQFQIGSIKSDTNTTIRLYLAVFQFQIGSIKSAKYVRAAPTIPMFQFQIGSIKRLKLKPPPAPPACRFNSKLVRLKERNLHRERRVSMQFQFQIGSIKRKIVTRMMSRRPGFNSKLVRLKEVSVICLNNFLIRFNSKLVRLKGLRRRLRRRLRLCFNSKLVRLKVRLIRLFVCYS